MTLTPDILWTSALVAIPVAIAIAVLCRLFVRQPATRHALWVIALLSLVLPALGAAAGAARWQPTSWILPREPAPSTIDTPPGADPAETPPQTTPARPQETAPGAPPQASATSAPLSAPLAAPSAAPLSPPTPTAAATQQARKRAPSGTPVPEIADSTAAQRPHRVLPQQTAAAHALTLEPMPAETTARPPTAAPARAARPPAPAAPPASGKVAGASNPVESGGRGLAARSQAPAALLVAALRAGLQGELRARVANLTARASGVRDALATLPALPLPVWIAGTVIAVALGLVRLRQQRARWRRAQPAGPRLRAQIERAAAELELRRAPACRITTDHISPMICCAGRPRLLLPEALWRQLDAPSQRAVLLHELAHIRRRDHLSCWVQAVIGWVYWWHPVVWWVRGRIQEEADLCCDAWVVALMPAGRRAYAEALLSARSWVSAGSDRCAVGLPMATARSRRFSRRLTMVMTAPPRPRVNRAGAAIAAAVALAGALLMPAVACPPEKKKKAHVAVHVTTHEADKAHETPEAPAEEASTFERFMQERERGGQPESGARGGSADDEARLRQLEDRLRRLEETLSALARDRDRDRDRDLDRDRERESRSAPRAPRGAAPAPSTPPAPPAPPTPPAPPAPPGPDAVSSPHSAPTAPGAHGLRLPAPDSGEELRIRYYLPSGKLGEINDLMVRRDVPVLVSPGDEYIVVIGTADTQQRFYSFVTLIHPEGVKAVDHESGEAVTPTHDHPGADPHEASHDQAREIRQRVQREVREQVRRHEAQMRACTAESQARLTELRSQARSLEGQHKSSKRLAERAKAEAADLQQQSQALRQKLAEAQKAVSEATGSARDEAEQMVARLEAEAGVFQARAMDIARRAEHAARESTAYAQQVINLEAIAGRLEDEMKAREAEVEQIIRQRLEEVEEVIRQSGPRSR